MIQAVDFTRLMQACHQVASNLLTSLSCIKSLKIRLARLDICRLAAVVKKEHLKNISYLRFVIWYLVWEITKALSIIQLLKYKFTFCPLETRAYIGDHFIVGGNYIVTLNIERIVKYMERIP